MDGAVFRGRAVYLEGTETLVVADLHVGRDEVSGVEFPLGERADLLERIRDLLVYFDVSEVVFAGDLLHSFDTASAAVRRSVQELTDACREASARPVLVEGNHDTLLGEVWDGTVYDAYRVDDRTVVCHGHERPSVEAERFVVGHDHPVISIEGQRRPCFLYGSATYRGGDVLMLPAFNRLVAGVEINGMRTRDFQSPLVTDADAFQPIVYDTASQEVLWFPPLGRFREML